MVANIDSSRDITALSLDRVVSEIGTILVVTEESAICAVDFADRVEKMSKLLDRRYTDYRLEEITHPHKFTRQLQAYLAGDLSAIADIPVSLGGTPFQQQVWLALRSIPGGTTMSYQQLATQIGNPQAARAVGMANSQNPIAIVLPCHRVIGSDGKLTGYAGGLDRQQWLLEHERRSSSSVK